jgi:oligopeptide/dipeptide ABC transporter ATP-binding protein
MTAPDAVAPSASVSGEPLLEIDDLEVTFRTQEGRVQAVRGIDLTVRSGEVLGVVGESGSGKSVTMLAAMGLLPRSAEIAGSVRLRGEELRGAAKERLRRIRGKEIAMIFQDPMTSLNPVFTVGSQIVEALRTHDKAMSKAAAKVKAVDLLKLVSIPHADRRLDDYPHQFSGGMRQRAMIAMAVANDPDVLIADEPTTALDVTIQAQILEVLQDVRQRLGIGIVLITHDLGVVAGLADRIAVMYAGRVVEQGTVNEVFYSTHHPYTLGLLASIPRLDRDRQDLVPVRGTPPAMSNPPVGCSFNPRCDYAIDRCRVEDPRLRQVGPVLTACHRAEEVGEPQPLTPEGSTTA